MGTLTPRASLIARRLYLSALAPLAVTGVAVVIGVGVSALHDWAVTHEDRACFRAAKAKTFNGSTFAPATEWEDVTPAPEPKTRSGKRSDAPTRRLPFDVTTKGLNEPKRKAERRQTLPPPPPGFTLDPDPNEFDPSADPDKYFAGVGSFDPDKFLYAEQCHLDFTYNPEGRSTREWYGLDLPGGVAVAMLALLPALLLMVLARWLRWLLKS